MITIKKHSGTSMIEVLVTTAILAIGLLGTFTLQITSIRGTSSAHYRTVATILSNEMAERIRSNPDGVSAGGYAISSSSSIVCNSLAEETVDCSSTSCSASQLATFDKIQVTCGHASTSIAAGVKTGGIANSLPEGSLSISCGSVSCNGDTDHTIAITWSEQSGIKGESAISAAITLTITP